MVTGLLHDGKKVAFDPTVKSQFALTHAISLFDDTDSKKIFATTLDKTWEHHLRDNVVFDMYDANNRLKQDVLSCNGLSDVGNIYLDTSLKLIKYASDFVDFNREEQPKVKRLATLNKKLICPNDRK